MSNIKYRDNNGDFVDLIDPLDYYPVGSLYLSYDSTSPAGLFGGTWTDITGRFLYTGKDTTVGGSEKHSHDWGLSYRAYFGLIAHSEDNQLIVPVYFNENNDKDWTHLSSVGPQLAIPKRNYGIDPLFYSDSNLAVTSMDINSNTSYNNWKPPYQTVYCWRRTA